MLLALRKLHFLNLNNKTLKIYLIKSDFTFLFLFLLMVPELTIEVWLECDLHVRH
jgi:hypothetical protein